MAKRASLGGPKKVFMKPGEGETPAPAPAPEKAPASSREKPDRKSRSFGRLNIINIEIGSAHKRRLATISAMTGDSQKVLVKEALNLLYREHGVEMIEE
ncbi:MAG: hypothetical protein ABW166_17850 [Sedimenticola sp.]